MQMPVAAATPARLLVLGICLALPGLGPSELKGDQLRVSYHPHRFGIGHRDPRLHDLMEALQQCLKGRPTTPDQGERPGGRQAQEETRSPPQNDMSFTRNLARMWSRFTGLRIPRQSA
jgi:hypothetical protein